MPVGWYNISTKLISGTFPDDRFCWYADSNANYYGLPDYGMLKIGESTPSCDESQANKVHYTNRAMLFRIYGVPVDALDTTPPTIEIYNCTSCGQDLSEPFTTEDTTPTFWIETDENAYCAIADVDANYTTMINGDSERNCSGGGTQHLTCTLQPSDALIINETDYVYIACKDTSVNENENTTSTSGPLEMEITSSQVEILGDQAIMAGINTSTIWPATVYSDQQVYLRDLNNNQVLATFDKLAVYDNQRWAFNYLNYIESYISGLFNLTTAFYAEEYKELTYQNVNDSVRTLIDNTKTS